MAKRKTRRKGARKAPAADTPKAVALKIQVEPSPDTPVYYGNHVEISHSPHDFVLSVVRVPAKTSSANFAEIVKTGVMPLEPQAQFTLPTTLARPLIAALERQVAAYEKLIGPIPIREGKSDAKKR